MIAQVLSVMTHHEMRPPASVTLLGRALVTLEGTLRVLEPDFSMADASKDLVRQHRGAFGSPREILQREMLRVLPALRTLPEHAEAIASQLRGGSLTVRTERYAGGDRDVVDRWVDRAVLAGIGGFAGVASALLLVAAAATDNTKVQTGMTLAAILMLRGAARALRRHATRLD
jgi:ubiquinone biosynthesis protein